MTGDRERPLMEATLRIIGRNGLDGVTHRAVAAEAKMSVGALTHHFASRDILVDAALAFALSREVGRLRALALSLQGKAFDLEGWIHELVNWYAQELKTQRRDPYRLLRGVPGRRQESTSSHCRRRMVRHLAAERGTGAPGRRLIRTAPPRRAVRVGLDRPADAAIGGAAPRFSNSGEGFALSAGQRLDCEVVTRAGAISSSIASTFEAHRRACHRARIRASRTMRPQNNRR